MKVIRICKEKPEMIMTMMETCDEHLNQQFFSLSICDLQKEKKNILTHQILKFILNEKSYKETQSSLLSDLRLPIFSTKKRVAVPQETTSID